MTIILEWDIAAKHWKIISDMKNLGAALEIYAEMRGNEELKLESR